MFSIYLALRQPAFSTEAVPISPALAIGLVGVVLFTIGWVARRWPRVGWWFNIVAASLMGLYLLLR
jgi:hypothetical protein